MNNDGQVHALMTHRSNVEFAQVFCCAAVLIGEKFHIVEQNSKVNSGERRSQSSITKAKARDRFPAGGSSRLSPTQSGSKIRKIKFFKNSTIPSLFLKTQWLWPWKNKFESDKIEKDTKQKHRELKNIREFDEAFDENFQRSPEIRVTAEFGSKR